MHQPLAVRGVERAGDLLDEPHGVVRREPTVTAQHLAEVLALDQPHVEEELAVDLAVAVDRDDVRVGERRGEPRLPAETSAVQRVLRQRRRQHLQRDPAVLLGVVGAVDIAHAAAAEQCVEPVRPEHRLRHAGLHGGAEATRSWCGHCAIVTSVPAAPAHPWSRPRVRAPDVAPPAGSCAVCSWREPEDRARAPGPWRETEDPARTRKVGAASGDRQIPVMSRPTSSVWMWSVPS